MVISQIKSYEFTIAQWRKILDQTDNNDVKIINTRLKYNTLDPTAKRQFHIITRRYW